MPLTDIVGLPTHTAFSGSMIVVELSPSQVDVIVGITQPSPVPFAINDAWFVAGMPDKVKLELLAQVTVQPVGRLLIVYVVVPVEQTLLEPVISIIEGFVPTPTAYHAFSFDSRVDHCYKDIVNVQLLPFVFEFLGNEKCFLRKYHTQP